MSMEKTPESRQPLSKRTKAVIAATGLAVASLVGLQLSRSFGSDNGEAPVSGQGVTGQELVAQESLLSNNIGTGKPITLKTVSLIIMDRAKNISILKTHCKQLLMITVKKSS